MEDNLRRQFTVTQRILSEADGTVEYVASDNTIDSYDEIVLASGWRFDLFEKNSPFVDSHNYWTIRDLLGRVDSGRVEGNALIERVTWAKNIPENALAVLGWKMTVGGFLKAVSVGFRSIKSVRNGADGWNAAVTAAGLDLSRAAGVRRIFLEHQQLELSACILGANPNAVAKAHKEGCIRDADLAAVGFSDEDMHFLSIAGAACEGDVSDVTKLLIEREMSRITKRSSTSMPGKPDGGEEVMRQAAERTGFLKQLQALVKK
ncbi:MAG: hypothetical protein ABIT37_05875 [Luteolibacter sp.]